MLPFDILIWLGVAFCGGIILFVWWNRAEFFTEPPIYAEGLWSLPIQIAEENLGYIEGENPLLLEVIVVAHRVEEPKDGLLKAVKNNFRRNIIYRFIISDSSYAEEKEKYIRVFEGYANAERPADCPHERLVVVHKLGREWTDVPYLFYRSHKQRNSEEELIFGYSGSQIGEGIASDYALMGPRQAHTIFRLVEGFVGEDVLPSVPASNFRASQSPEEKAQERWFGRWDTQVKGVFCKN